MASQVANCAWLEVAVPGVDDLVWVAGGSQNVAMDVPCDSLLAVDILYPTPMPTLAAASVDAPRPATGPIAEFGVNSGQGELLIKNGTDGDGVVVLTTIDDSPTQAVYIRAGDSYDITGMRDGKYRLYFAKGDGWDAGRKQFNRDVTRQRFEDTWSLKPRTRSTPAYEVTLYGVANGNAATENVSSAQFPTLK